MTAHDPLGSVAGSDRASSSTRFVLAAGSTATAAIDGISAAGADPEAMTQTPGADAELLAYGDVVRAPAVPVSPSGTPTPAVVSRAVREVLGFDLTVVDAGLAAPTGAPTVTVGARAGDDIREPDPVPTAPGCYAASRELGRSLPDDHVVLAETIPGGTTTALGVLRALGEDATVSSSFAENPIELKRDVVAAALDASGLAPGDCTGDPRAAIRRVGDPVQATLAGITAGALESGTRVTLAGGTQQLAVAALVRHAGVDDPLQIATTTYVADDVDAQSSHVTDQFDPQSSSVGDDLDPTTTDPTTDPPAGFCAAARALDCDPVVTDPGFDADHRGFGGYVAGEAKEGVGMGGALALADAAGELDAVRDRAREVYDRVT